MRFLAALLLAGWFWDVPRGPGGVALDCHGVAEPGPVRFLVEVALVTYGEEPCLVCCGDPCLASCPGTCPVYTAWPWSIWTEVEDTGAGTVGPVETPNPPGPGDYTLVRMVTVDAAGNLSTDRCP